MSRTSTRCVPLWLALREYHGSITPDWGPLRSPEESWTRRRKDYVDILAEGGVLFLHVGPGRDPGLRDVRARPGRVADLGVAA